MNHTLSEGLGWLEAENSGSDSVRKKLTIYENESNVDGMK